MKLEKIQILTNNIQETTAFYQDILGLSIIEKTQNGLQFRQEILF